MKEKIEPSSTVKKGTSLEIEVMNIYKELGANKVVQDCMIGGNQIDVYVEMPALDGTIHRMVIDCKNWNSKVGKTEAITVCNVFTALRNSNLIDKGIILTNIGSTKDAKTVADSNNVFILLHEDLKNKLLDLTPHMNRLIEEYEGSKLFKSDCYIPQRAKRIKDKDNTEEVIPDNLLTYFNDKKINFVLILGEYGSGKSTLVKTLAYNLSKNYLQQRGSEIPFFINLRDYRKIGTMNPILSDIIVNDGIHGGTKKQERFYKYLSDGKIILFLDGFDEMIMRADLTEVTASLNEILKLVKKECKIILTCRTAYFRSHEEYKQMFESSISGQKISEEMIECVELELFNEDEIKTYMEKVLGDVWEGLYTKMKSMHKLLELAEKPILLDMISTTLPEIDANTKVINPAVVYDHYISKWLTRDDWRGPLKYQQREHLSEQLALEMFEKDITSMEASMLGDWVSKQFPDLSSPRELENFEYNFRTGSFLTRNQEGYFYFVHESFQEFLIAKIYKRMLEDKDISVLIEKKTNDEILLFVRELLLADDKLFENYLKEIGNKKVNISEKIKILKIFGFVEKSAPNLNDTRLKSELQTLEDWRYLSLYKEDLSNLKRPKAKLNGTTLKNVDLQNSNLVNSIIINGKFSDVNLTNAELNYIILHDSTLINCNFNNSKFNYSEVLRTNMKECQFQEVEFEEAVFKSCDLSGANLWRANLSGAKFHGCNLEGVQFSETEIKELEFYACNLSDASFRNLEIPKKLRTLLKTQNRIEGAKFDDEIMDEMFPSKKQVISPPKRKKKKGFWKRK